MTREELIRNLKYTMKKHENDTVSTFGTNISLMCKDVLDYLEQEPILDKIRAEIEQTTSRYCLSKECFTIGQIEWSDRLIKESEVLQIIDKYKAESEDKE